MGSAYSQHILDPFLNDKIVANFGEVDKYKGLADKTFINEPLAQFGQQEQGKIFSGNIGSTMLAGAARTQGARDIASLKASQRLGGSAMARRGSSPGAAANNFLYDRMLQNQTNKVNDRTADQVVQGLPGYVNSAANWSEAGNRGRAQQMQMAQGYQGMFSNAVKLRQSNETFTKKKSLWDKIKEGVAVAGNIAGIVSGIGGHMNMNSGGETIDGMSPTVQGDTGAGNGYKF